MIKMSKMHKRLCAKSAAMLALSAVLPIGTAYADEVAAAPAAISSDAAPAAATDAAAPAAGQLETVTVTAQRRKENIRDVPVSVSLLRDEKLDVLVSGGQDIRMLAGKVPSLNVESSNGRTFPRFYIRGYGNTDFNIFASQPVSLIYDDVVQENPILKGYPLFDVAGVEVLRGPQGTLFGRNTPAGVVKFESVKPNLDKVEGYYNVSTATHNTSNFDGAVNVPLSKEWAMRFSTLRQHRDDYVDNTYTGQKNALDGYNEHAERVQLLYAPTGSGFNALFNVHQRTTAGSARLFFANLIKPGTNDIVDGFDPTKISINAPNFQSLSTNGASARLSWDLDGIKLYSITGFEHVGQYASHGDIDGGTPNGPGFIPFQVETQGGITSVKQYSQEFRAESKNAGPLNWQAGLYYFNEDANGYSDDYFTDTHLLKNHLASRQKNTAWATFGSVNYAVSDDFMLRAGLRYTKDKKDFTTVAADNIVQVNPTSADVSKGKVNWDLSGTYKYNKDVNFYGRIATGFRAPSIAPASTSVPVTVADAETITSYEAGIKADLFDRRARLSFSLYDYQIKNQQLTVVGGNSNVTRLINAAKTDGRGAELELEGFVTPSLKMSFGGSYNFTEIKDPTLAVAKCASCTVLNPINAAGNVVINGNPLPQAPKWTLTATGRYSIPTDNGEFFVFTDWSYRSEINFFLYQSTEFTGKPLLEGGLRTGYNWDGGKYEVALFGRNITNTRRVTGAIDFDNLTGFVNDPRQWGVQFKGNF
ncbi:MULTISPECIES: TonB-dependent receptor [unclassified Janthinobacterium]|uniref:TonB-dependent receptor n=1 Tax=unclassified Janthinobacterium TaxID=2610881 RepID=UPI00161046DA|nr:MULTISPECIES: TonB-dependent receptor [unclassified Janthinobacterium]MBB5369487.1 iron complex outermembrane receptor protein [Janthinobacterium sp. K2C7]MBB5382557.1 iron complex outermembrane receptor protein [Janthinobacterium sp. K2Li3]MBB5388134.1 iron complex outermembrane receptor protein [Janthinobacterium sp. K2E3]